MKIEGTSLSSLPAKKLTTGHNKLQEAGITPNRWLAMLDADNAAMQHLGAAWPGGLVGAPQTLQGTGIVYDVAATSRILGIPAECGDSVPHAADGEIVVYYGGWDLSQLRISAAGMKRMWQNQDWYEKYGWRAEPGYYRVLPTVPGSNQYDWYEQYGYVLRVQPGYYLPVPNSKPQSWSEQLRRLANIDSSWQATPICIAATAFLVHLTETGNNPLKNGWCCCAESLPDDNLAGLSICEGRVYINSHVWTGRRFDNLWLSAARKS